MSYSATSILFFFFNDTATTEIYTLSLHDALPILRSCIDPKGVTWARSATFSKPPNGSIKPSKSSLPKSVSSVRSEEHTSELQSQSNIVCRLLLENKKSRPSCTKANDSDQVNRRST